MTSLPWKCPLQDYLPLRCPLQDCLHSFQGVTSATEASTSGLSSSFPSPISTVSDKDQYPSPRAQTFSPIIPMFELTTDKFSHSASDTIHQQKIPLKAMMPYIPQPDEQEALANLQFVVLVQFVEEPNQREHPSFIHSPAILWYSRRQHCRRGITYCLPWCGEWTSRFLVDHVRCLWQPESQ